MFKALKHRIKMIRREIHVHRNILDLMFLLWIFFLAINIITVTQIDKIIKVADRISIIEIEDVDINEKNWIILVHDKHISIVITIIINGHLYIDVIGSKSVDSKGIRIVSIY